MNKQVIERNFSRFAASYDDYADIQQRVAQELLLQIEDKPIESILEIGSGTGNYSSLLRGRFRSARISAFDVSTQMVEVAKAKHQHERINFFQADARNLNLQESFDLITSNACLHWVKDLEKVILSCQGLLEKDGTIAFSIFGPLTFLELSESINSLMKDENIEAKNFPDQEKIDNIMRKNFNSSNIKEVIFREEYPNLEELLYKIKFTGTNGSGLNQKNRFSRGLLQQLENTYLDKFKSIIATYQVFFCRGKV